MKALRSRTWGRKHCSPFLRGGKTDCRGAAYLSISASTRRRRSSPILIATLTVAIGITLGNTELAFQGEFFRWRVRPDSAISSPTAELQQVLDGDTCRKAKKDLSRARERARGSEF